MEIKKYDYYLKSYYNDCLYRKCLSEKTIKPYQIDLKQFFDFIGKGTIESKCVNEFIYYLNERYSKHKTIKRKLASIKAFYSYLEFEEVIESTPFKKIRTKIKEPEILPKTIAKDNIKQILSFLYTCVSKAKSEYQERSAIRNIAMIELLFTTGMRISELCNLREEDIDLKERFVKIFGKGSKERILYIGNESVIDVLKEYRKMNASDIKKEGYFFLNKNRKKISEQSVRILLKKKERSLILRVTLRHICFAILLRLCC